MEAQIARTSQLNQSIEDRVRQRLVRDYAAGYGDKAGGYVDGLLAIEHYRSRFVYLQSVVGSGLFERGARVLISGFSVGSEMIVAREFGFGRVDGVEVDHRLVEVCQERLSSTPDMHPICYKGDYLPYEDGGFDLVASAHVIEHTGDPSLYIRECLRVLSRGGYLTLEFPTRYHWRELHSGMPSLEWLPRPVRNLGIRLMTSPISRVDPAKKVIYRTLLVDGLQQISVGGIRRMVSRSGIRANLLDSRRVLPGIVRCVLQKTT